ncbi:hypothetical protein [Bifidobacterium felsineum]|uniref:hypothetical protein n=1 Tax=Bifidobacterium felsineum TaxID=2045440 RepID=UPI001BDDB609|nr:hypothetical protein [Bifidobacterium felsineum]MBT1164653.1 hypothetical protein [Bifidobacterium felsineum]
MADEWHPWMDDPVRTGVTDGVEWRIVAHNVYFAWQGYARIPDGHVWRHLSADDLDPLVHVYGGITYGPDEEGWIGFDTLQGNSSMISLDGEDLDERRRALCAMMGWPYVEPHKWTCDEVEAETKRMAASIAANDSRP